MNAQPSWLRETYPFLSCESRGDAATHNGGPACSRANDGHTCRVLSARVHTTIHTHTYTHIRAYTNVHARTHGLHLLPYLLIWIVDVSLTHVLSFPRIKQSNREITVEGASIDQTSATVTHGSFCTVHSLLPSPTFFLYPHTPSPNPCTLLVGNDGK